MLVNRDSYPFFAALASETRLAMVELLAEKPMNIRDIAETLGLSSSIIAKHVQMMESAGVIKCKTMPGERGLQKVCSLVHDGLALNFGQAHYGPEINVVEVAIGNYFAWSAKAPCGLATQESFIGYQDDVRSFTNPRRTDAGLIWVSSGYLEYIIPNYVHTLKPIGELRIQLEICSEAPGWDVSWPSARHQDLLPGHRHDRAGQRHLRGFHPGSHGHHLRHGGGADERRDLRGAGVHGQRHLPQSDGRGGIVKGARACNDNIGRKPPEPGCLTW